MTPLYWRNKTRTERGLSQTLSAATPPQSTSADTAQNESDTLPVFLILEYLSCVCRFLLCCCCPWSPPSRTSHCLHAWTPHPHRFLPSATGIPLLSHYPGSLANFLLSCLLFFGSWWIDFPEKGFPILGIAGRPSASLKMNVSCRHTRLFFHRPLIKEIIVTELVNHRLWNKRIMVINVLHFNN